MPRPKTRNPPPDLRRARRYVPEEKKIVAKKQLGQHFLADPNAIRKIIEACRITKDDCILEIGPGLGALTERILPLAGRIIAVETDRRLVAELNAKLADDRLTVIHADFMDFILDTLPSPMKAVGNLPYYISTPIIEKVITNRNKFSSLFMTVQLEFGERIAAKPGTKAYGSLSCFVQYYAQVIWQFKIKNVCFRPVPKVDSCFIELRFHKEPPLKAKDEDFLFKIIRTAFQQRRKTFPKTLDAIVDRGKTFAVLDAMGIDRKVRPERLSLDDFVRISNALAE